jgi:hypothetical protein
VLVSRYFLGGTSIWTTKPQERASSAVVSG